MACAIPVRGRLLGAECLGNIVEDPPPIPSAPAPIHRGDGLALFGFGIVVLLSLFPWSRFGEGAGFLQAWRGHWSLVAVLGAVAGAILAWRMRSTGIRRPWLEAAAYGVLAVMVAASSILYWRHPPVLTRASLVPRLALLGAAVALAGGVSKAWAAWQADRHRRGVG